MVSLAITDAHKEKIKHFLKGMRSPDLITTYLYFLELKYELAPVLVPREKTIFRSLDQAIAKLEEEGKLWKSTEITVDFGPPQVNEETQKIYICPFTGKVFGNNTHPNPQDAIYDWVSKCPENKERAGGLRTKRFFVSEDPEIIKNYIKPPKEPIKKTAYTSQITGKLFNSKRSVIEDFKQNQTKQLTLVEAQNQNRFEIEEQFLNFIKQHLQEKHIAEFVNQIAEDEDLISYVEKWLEEE